MGDARFAESGLLVDLRVAPSVAAEYCNCAQANSGELGELVVQCGERVAYLSDDLDRRACTLEPHRLCGDRGAKLLGQPTGARPSTSLRWHGHSARGVDLYGVSGSPPSRGPAEIPS